MKINETELGHDLVRRIYENANVRVTMLNDVIVNIEKVGAMKNEVTSSKETPAVRSK